MCANVNTYPIPVYTLGYMLTDVLCNPEAYTNWHSTFVHSLCVLENGGLSECYNRIYIFVFFSMDISEYPPLR